MEVPETTRGLLWRFLSSSDVWRPRQAAPWGKAYFKVALNDQWPIPDAGDPENFAGISPLANE
jgi:hypothetical protein